jgi:hypothetical protein
LKNRYYVWLGGRGEPIPWTPPRSDGMPRRDCDYFGNAFVTMEQFSLTEGLTVYLTWDHETLPSYGRDVVAVLTGDESCRIPRWFERVRATYRTYGTVPRYNHDLLRHRTRANAMSALLFARDCATYVPGLVRYAACRRKRRVPPVYGIPLGYFNQPRVPMIPLLERSADVFFAGSIQNDRVPLWCPGRLLTSPKTVSRRDMLAAVRRLSVECPEARVRLNLQSDFAASASADGYGYSRALVDSKICLVPRGTADETFRLHEALRSGCVVVADARPRRWWLTGAPLLFVARWAELPGVVAPLLADPDKLLELQSASLAWWESRCSERALGRFMAGTLDADGLPANGPFADRSVDHLSIAWGP